MSSTWRKISKVFLSYQRSDRNAIVIIATLFFLVFIGNVLIRNIPLNSNADFTEIKTMIAEWEKAGAEKKAIQNYFDFDPNSIIETALDSLSIPQYVKQNLLSYRKAGGKYKTPADVRKLYGMNDSIFTLIENHIKIRNEIKVVTIPKIKKRKVPSSFFDPNNASVSELNAYGFSNFQANNLVSYCEKGGVFNTATDLLIIYGIDSVFYNEIAGFIKIEKAELEITAIPKEIILVELNSADSIDLVGLNGIGPAYAKRIIKYRNLLGGFYSKEQLKEVYNFPVETYNNIQNNISVDTLTVIKLRINFSEYSELLKHPYLNKKQVNALTRKRESSGSFKSITELQSVEGFDSEIIAKISPYITCR